MTLKWDQFMHFALKVQAPDTFQERGVSLNAGVKNQGINLEDWMQSKKVQQTALAVDIKSKANKQPAGREGIWPENLLLRKAEGS